MKKICILMLLLIVSIIASAQKKMTIKTVKGQKVEVSCDGIAPKEIKVAPDGTVTLKLAEGEMETSVNLNSEVNENQEETDSIDTFVETDSLAEARQVIHNDSLVADSLLTDNFTDSDSGKQTALGLIANSLAEELSPEYAAFEKEHEGTHPASERELIKDVAKKFLNEDDVEAADFLATLFSGIRFTKDSTFVPTYEQRKPKSLLRTFDTIELSGDLGKNIEDVNVAISGKIKAEDYGDDTENHHKYGGGIKYSRVYMSGSMVDNEWRANPLGFAWSWGGLLSYSSEEEIGDYVNIMAKAGVQIGSDICVGVDALVGSGITPYNTFLSNGLNHNLVNKSVWCFKYGVQLWGSLNFSKNTYTAFYGRYINSVKPNNGRYVLSYGWEVVCEDFDPSSWAVGLAVGYKFGAPHTLSQDKRLQASLNTGYQFVGNKGMFVSAEFERLTQVSKSTSLSYGLLVEDIFGNGDKGGDMKSIMLSAGFQVCQPHNSWFWGAKLFGGAGGYPVVNSASDGEYDFKDYCTKLCARGSLQLSTGFRIGKCSSVSAFIRAGYHFGNSMKFENFEETNDTQNISGFDCEAGLGYKLTF